MDIYTPIEEAGKIIRERWANQALRRAVEENMGDGMPEILKNGPRGLIWRCICTPDGEFNRFLELCNRAKLMPAGFENSQDKFHSGNFTKNALVNLVFSQGLDKNGKHIVVKEKIVDINGSGRKRMCDIDTLWGENLVDFHHFF